MLAKSYALGAFILCILPALAAAAQGLDRVKPSHADITYAATANSQLKLDLYIPKQKSHLIVWVHGGAWHRGSKYPVPAAVLQLGYAVASVGYRLSTEANFPAPIHDIKAAIRFLRANAKRYGYFSDKIVIWGLSAGGHLAALVGLTNGVQALEGNLGKYTKVSSDVQAIIDCYGPSNFTTILSQSTPHGINVRAPALALLLGGPLERRQTLAELASPVSHVDKTDPPLLIMHGDQDNQVPINQSHELHGLYKKFDLDVQFVVAHGVGHKQQVFSKPEYLEIVKVFLERVLKPE